MGTVLLCMVLIIGGVIVYIQNRAHADTIALYPSKCFGTWENPSFAEGIPETIGDNDKEEQIKRNELNSAVFGGGMKELFCGHFAKMSEQEREIISVKVNIHWDIGREKESIPKELKEVSDSGLNEEKNVIGDEKKEEILIEDLEKNPTEDEKKSLLEEKKDESIIATPSPYIEHTPQESVEELMGDPLQEHSMQKIRKNIFSSVFIKNIYAQESPQGSQEPQPSLSATPHTTQSPEVSSSPEKTPEPSLFPTFSPNTSSSSEMSPQPSVKQSPELLPEESLGVSPDPETEILPSPTTNDPYASSSAQEYPLCDTSLFEEPPQEAQVLFKIMYTIDGEEWKPLGWVSETTWKEAHFELYVSGWKDLSVLQIKIENSPLIDGDIYAYLDGMELEVEYKEEEKKDSSSAFFEEPEIKIFNEESKHACTSNPFTNSIRKGESAQIHIELLPSYEFGARSIEVGEIPQGMEAIISQKTATSALLSVQTDENMATGSFNIVVIYNERQKTCSWLPNFCQINIIVTE